MATTTRRSNQSPEGPTRRPVLLYAEGGPFFIRTTHGNGRGMDRETYRKSESQLVQGLCAKCGERAQRKAGLCKKGPHLGKQTYDAVCGVCNWQLCKTRYSGPETRYGYKALKKEACEACGFVALDPCQLDVDHVDGDHSNNDPKNLQTLCANCHRLKTKQCRDGVYGRYRTPMPDHLKRSNERNIP